MASLKGRLLHFAFIIVFSLVPHLALTNQEIRNLERYQGIRFDLIPSLDLYEKLCPGRIASSELLGSQLNAICQTVVDSKICGAIPEQDRLRCDESHLENKIDLWSYLKGCAQGALQSVQNFLDFVWEVMKWVWENSVDAEKRSATFAQASEYGNSIKLYLYTEYEKAYSKAEGPLKELQALRGMADTIGRLILNQLVSAIQGQYDKFGCLKAEVKAKVTCEFVGEIFMPPAAAVALLKYGSKSLRNHPNLEKAISNLRNREQHLGETSSTSGKKGASAGSTAPLAQGSSGRSEPVRQSATSAANYQASQLQDDQLFIDGSRGVKYLSESEQKNLQVSVRRDGRLVLSDGTVADTRTNAASSDLDRGLYAMSPDGEIYLAKNSNDRNLTHSSLLGGQPAAAVGEIQIEDGIIKMINSNSDHYPSDRLTLEQLLSELARRGARMEGASIDELAPRYRATESAAPKNDSSHDTAMTAEPVIPLVEIPISAKPATEAPSAHSPISQKRLEELKTEYSQIRKEFAKTRKLNPELIARNNAFIRRTQQELREQGILTDVFEINQGALGLKLTGATRDANRAGRFYTRAGDKFAPESITFSLLDQNLIDSNAYIKANGSRVELSMPSALMLLENKTSIPALHEFRHQVFLARRNQGKGSIYDVKFLAAPKTDLYGHLRAGPSRIYDDYMSGEELYTYARDIRNYATRLRKYSDDERKKIVQFEISHLDNLNTLAKNTKDLVRSFSETLADNLKSEHVQGIDLTSEGIKITDKMFRTMYVMPSSTYGVPEKLFKTMTNEKIQPKDFFAALPERYLKAATRKLRQDPFFRDQPRELAQLESAVADIAQNPRQLALNPAASLIVNAVRTVFLKETVIPGVRSQLMRLNAKADALLEESKHTREAIAKFAQDVGDPQALEAVTSAAQRLAKTAQQGMDL